MQSFDSLAQRGGGGALVSATITQQRLKLSTSRVIVVESRGALTTDLWPSIMGGFLKRAAPMMGIFLEHPRSPYTYH